MCELCQVGSGIFEDWSGVTVLAEVEGRCADLVLDGGCWCLGRWYRVGRKDRFVRGRKCLEVTWSASWMGEEKGNAS